MIHEHDWLQHAKRLAVGMRLRIRHGKERRLNMTVANERDRWWCYCQACKDGGVVHKEHVLLNTAAVPIKDEDLAVPLMGEIIAGIVIDELPTFFPGAKYGFQFKPLKVQYREIPEPLEPPATALPLIVVPGGNAIH